MMVPSSDDIPSHASVRNIGSSPHFNFHAPRSSHIRVFVRVQTDTQRERARARARTERRRYSYCTSSAPLSPRLSSCPLLASRQQPARSAPAPPHAHIAPHARGTATPTLFSAPSTIRDHCTFRKLNCARRAAVSSAHSSTMCLRQPHSPQVTTARRGWR